jgi:hypothetical protein
MQNTKQDREIDYAEKSQKALKDFQSGLISFAEWNRIQKQAVEKFYA